MPLEFFLLMDKMPTHAFCPKCKVKPFKPFMRGEVHSPWRKLIVRSFVGTVKNRLIGRSRD